MKIFDQLFDLERLLAENQCHAVVKELDNNLYLQR